jgi:hypothetical protein
MAGAVQHVMVASESHGYTSFCVVNCEVCCDSERYHTCLKIALSVENIQNNRAIFNR